MRCSGALLFIPGPECFDFRNDLIRSETNCDTDLQFFLSMSLSEESRIKDAYKQYHDENARERRWSPENRGNRAMVEERCYLAREKLLEAGFVKLDSLQLLEVGCGDGSELDRFESMGFQSGNLTGVDLLENRINAARTRCPKYSFHCCNAERLPFAERSFDFVAVYTVFSSILDPQMRANVAKEINRVLRIGGFILFYDFRVNNPWNTHTRGMVRRDIVHLFQGFECSLWSTTLVPPLARRLGPLTGVLYPQLAAVPVLRTHYFGLLRKLKNR
jgi:SAM-dependent methyltransferase